MPLARCLGSLALALLAGPAAAQPLPLVAGVEHQPFAAQVRRLIEGADYLGEPFNAADRAILQAAIGSTDRATATRVLQEILDAHCLLAVTIEADGRVRVQPGPAKPELVEHGWRQFLFKVINPTGKVGRLRVVSPNAQSMHQGPRTTDRRSIETASDLAYRVGHAHPLHHSVADSWLDMQTFDAQPLRPELSGLEVEYRILQLYSRDAGPREAGFVFLLGETPPGTDPGPGVNLRFTCLPARDITLRVLDEKGAPATGSFVVRDARRRVYPSQAKRLAPDFAFHPQVYRVDGETLRLPDGTYDVEFNRGPESLFEHRRVTVGEGSQEWAFQVRRWIDPAALGWWSGDHHIHAAGCSHYTNPSEGVNPADMARHIEGEDLKVGAALTWRPGFDYQKQFFTGGESRDSRPPYLLRYDVEVSGFGSHQAGHLCLLRLRDQIYPGGDSWTHWPTLGLSILRWAKAQDAVAGTAHSGWGLQPVAPGDPSQGRGGWIAAATRAITSELPNYVVPPYNGIGANEFIVNLTHEVPDSRGRLVPAVDFIALVDSVHIWELNMWYHTLNAGFRPRGSGETDFPCIYGQRVGMGRSYVKVDGPLAYDAWCEGIRAGRAYVSDGKSHLLEFKANERAVGEQGSELRLPQAGTVTLTAQVGARLSEDPDRALQRLSPQEKPYWDIERARIGDSREVPVEVVVNGYPVARQNVIADGTLREVRFEIPIERSSWVALRIKASSHTNPIFVLVGDKPIRASRRSIEWCLKGVDQCWTQKSQFYAAEEMEQARAAYEHARQVYRQRLAECDVD